MLRRAWLLLKPLSLMGRKREGFHEIEDWKNRHSNIHDNSLLKLVRRFKKILVYWYFIIFFFIHFLVYHSVRAFRSKYFTLSNILFEKMQYYIIIWGRRRESRTKWVVTWVRDEMNSMSVPWDTEKEKAKGWTLLNLEVKTSVSSILRGIWWHLTRNRFESGKN